MEKIESLWLVTNAASGSNDEDALAALKHSFTAAGIAIVRIVNFPDDDLPTAQELDQAGSPLVAVFAGDGTINALVTSLYGWGGAILILPGGTMNLLYHRLHGQQNLNQVLDAISTGQARRCRPAIIRCDGGDGFAGVMAGPGTAWNDVREAMRDIDIPGIASGAAKAISQSVAAPMIACVEPRLGREEGYPLLVLTPQGGGFIIDAYHAETVGDYLAQGLALLKRDFREGPSDRLGTVKELVVRSVSSDPIGLLVDGEPADTGSQARFTLALCEVDLLATSFDE